MRSNIFQTQKHLHFLSGGPFSKDAVQNTLLNAKSVDIIVYTCVLRFICSKQTPQDTDKFEYCCLSST